MDDLAKHDLPVKHEPAFEVLEYDADLQQLDEGNNYDPTCDKRDMRRLGRIQEVKRRFRFFSIVGYMVILASTWECFLVDCIFSLSNGGTAGAIWMTLGACFGMFVTCLSMAEVKPSAMHSKTPSTITDTSQMASISPTAGGWSHCQ